MDIKTLYESKAKLVSEAHSFLNTHEDKDGTMSAEDSAAYGKIEQELANVEAKIARYENLAKYESGLTAPTARPILNTPQAGGAESVKTGRASAEYRQEFLHAVSQKFKKVSDVLQEGVDEDGGYLVPEEMDERLITALAEDNIMRKLGTVIQTAGTHKINFVATKPTAAWLDEGETLTMSTAKFDQIALEAHKVGVAVNMTEELNQDNIYSLESYLINLLAEAIAAKEEEACIVGNATGTAKTPTGLFVTATKTGSRETAGANIATDDIIGLVYDLKRPYRAKASFIMNDKIVAEIRKLKDDNKQYLWQPSLQQGEPDRLLGYPVYTSVYAPLLTTDAGERNAGAAIIAFGDMSYYNIADRGARSVQILKEIKALSGMTVMKVTERMDGRLILPEAVEVLKLKA